MGIKKIARPINKSKNLFIKWLKNNNVDGLDIYEGDKNPEWDYYTVVMGFVGETLYTVYFMIWKGELKIDYSDEENSYRGMSIGEFLKLME